MDISSRQVAAVALCLATFAVWGCKSFSERGAKGVGLLPKAPAGEQHFSNYQPRNPYSQVVTGLLGRKLYETPGPRGYRVEVHDFLVGPKQHTASATLPGSAIGEVRSGEGVLLTAGKRQELQPGITFTVAVGVAFTIENRSEVPIGIRVHLIRTE